MDPITKVTIFLQPDDSATVHVKRHSGTTFDCHADSFGEVIDLFSHVGAKQCFPLSVIYHTGVNNE